MSNDFENDINIDEFNLVEELVRQPQLYYDWAKKAVLANSDTLSAKDKLDLIKAEIELRIRKHPTLHRLPEKPTEAIIKAAVLVNRKVQRANKRYLEALRIEKILNKAERAFEHRKKSLEGLVQTNSQFYFASPRTDSRTRQKVDEDTLLKQARERKRIRRRK